LAVWFQQRWQRWGITWAAAVLLCRPATAPAQGTEPSDPRSVGVTAAFGVNILLGGLTAATRAWIDGHDAARAFAIGALGGAVHFGAKLVGPGTSLAGVAIGATGTSIVANAGRGVGALDELYVPVGPLRLRVMPRATRKVRVALHAYDAAVLARNLPRSGLVVDWGRTASSGTFVLRTDNRRIWSDDREVGGVAVGSLAVISDFFPDRSRITRHELVHVHQYWFADEAIGRPIEEYLRRVVPGAARLPRWLELGVVPAALAGLEGLIFRGDGPLHRLAESEADLLSR